MRNLGLKIPTICFVWDTQESVRKSICEQPEQGSRSFSFRQERNSFLRQGEREPEGEDSSTEENWSFMYQGQSERERIRSRRRTAKESEKERWGSWKKKCRVFCDAIWAPGLKRISPPSLILLFFTISCDVIAVRCVTKPSSSYHDTLSAIVDKRWENHKKKQNRYLSLSAIFFSFTIKTKKKMMQIRELWIPYNRISLSWSLKFNFTIQSSEHQASRAYRLVIRVVLVRPNFAHITMIMTRCDETYSLI